MLPCPAPCFFLCPSLGFLVDIFCVTHSPSMLEGSSQSLHFFFHVFLGQSIHSHGYQCLPKPAPDLYHIYSLYLSKWLPAIFLFTARVKTRVETITEEPLNQEPSSLFYSVAGEITSIMVLAGAVLGELVLPIKMPFDVTK